MLIIKLIVGFAFIILGVILTFKPKLNSSKEGYSDILAILGIIFMVIGVVLILSPFLR